MSDDYQIEIPPSFSALWVDPRGRLRVPLAELRQRYELCEDLSQHLVDQARTLAHGELPSDDEVLHRIHAGLCSPDSGLSADEARWIATRLAELLDWPAPAFGTDTDTDTREGTGSGAA